MSNVQRHEILEQDIKAAACGKRQTVGANRQSFDSADLRVLTPGNRQLLRMIRDDRPESVAQLARLSQRAEPNLLRTLAKLEALGLIELKAVGRRKMPVVCAKSLHVEIDPFAQNDKFELAR